VERSSKASAKIRSFNRFCTNISGLLNLHISDSDFSLTEARVLLEIGRTSQRTANELGNKLKIDRSYMSRILKGFERKKFITKTQSPGI